MSQEVRLLCSSSERAGLPIVRSRSPGSEGLEGTGPPSFDTRPFTFKHCRGDPPWKSRGSLRTKSRKFLSRPPLLIVRPPLSHHGGGKDSRRRPQVVADGARRRARHSATAPAQVGTLEGVRLAARCTFDVSHCLAVDVYRPAADAAALELTPAVGGESGPNLLGVGGDLHLGPT